MFNVSSVSGKLNSFFFLVREDRSVTKDGLRCLEKSIFLKMFEFR